jgi:ectoine hydroxylase-related dioxygenase (phytanoyl-CoA dioxygenase family)
MPLREPAPTREEVERYAKEGYLLLEDILSAQECQRLSRAADEAAGGHFANMLDLHDRSKAFHDLLVDPRILRVADAINGARMIPIGSVFFFCKPGNPLENGANMHQDNYAPKAPYGSYFVIGVPLDEADEGNGALQVIPGTHLLGDLPCTPSKNLEFDAAGRVTKAYPVGHAVELPEGYPPRQLRYRPGTLLLLHGHTVHGAPKNPSADRWRRIVYLHFIKDGDPFWPGWNARRRLIDRPDGPVRGA